MPASRETEADASRRFVLPDDAPLLANLAALWVADPALARDLELALEEPAHLVEPSKSGLPTVSVPVAGRRIYLHSKYQPLDEARKLADTSSLNEKTVVVIHGFALGYHVEAIFDRVGRETQFVVFEPDVRMLAAAFSHRDLSKLLSSKRLHLFTRNDRSALMLRLHDQQAMVHVGLGSIEHGPSVQAHPDFFRESKALIDEFAAFCKTSIQTIVLNGRRTAENISHNLGWYVAAPGIHALKNKDAGKPAIIVSAGPSLRKNKHLIKDAVGRATIIAVQTTLQPLLDMGIEPDYVTSLDYHDICTRFFEKLPANLRTRLIVEPKASAKVMELFPGPISITGNDFADKLIRPTLPHLSKDRLRAGATVAHLAFYLAEYLGCDPIIFVGQDLGFSDGLSYSPGTSYEDVWRPELSRFCTVEMRQWEHIVRERPILRRIPDQQGRPMYTEERLFSYLQQFERDFATSPATIIDATEGGALKRGATVMNLSDALDRYCAEANPLPRDMGYQPMRAPSEKQYRWDLLSPCIQSLQHRRTEANEIQSLSTQTLDLLHQIKQHLHDQPKVNRLIARVDVLKSRMVELNDSYELVTQLSQKTELERFRNDRLLAASRVEGLERQKRQLDRDIANVAGVRDAAGEFIRLMDHVIGELGACPQRITKDLAA